jgi:ADP-ribosyl-[dinitrogen reductase] hydrolase
MAGFPGSFFTRAGSTPAERRAGLWWGLRQGDRNGGPYQMALQLRNSLESLRRFCPEDVMARYLAWWSTEGFDAGLTAAGVFDLILTGLSHEAAAQCIHEESGGLTAGCNPAHRAVPLAMMDFLPLADLSGIARQEARLTHWHPEAGETSAAVVLLARHLIDDLPWPEAVQATATRVQGAVRAALLEPTCRPLDRDGHAPEVLRAAVAYLSRHRTFSSALQAALDFAGPANYCPVLVGALGGARWGIAAQS